jgi:quinol monooxygenase YgiN
MFLTETTSTILLRLHFGDISLAALVSTEERVMVSFTVRMRFDAEDREQVTELLRSLAEESRQEPGCVVYVPHRVEGEPDTVLIYEQYVDGAALDFHRASAHFRRYAIQGLYQLLRERASENLSALI